MNTEQDMKKATGPIISVSFINTLHLDPNALLQRNKCASEKPKPYMKYKKYVQNPNENVNFKKSFRNKRLGELQDLAYNLIF